MKTEHAKTAQEIRKILKREFPETKFKVKSDSATGTSSVDIYYTDSVPKEQVLEKVRHFKEGHFDGMQDLYELSNNREDIPQVKHIFVKRSVSEEHKNKMAEILGWKRNTLFEDNGFPVRNTDTEINYKLSKMDLNKPIEENLAVEV